MKKIIIGILGLVICCGSSWSLTLEEQNEIDSNVPAQFTQDQLDGKSPCLILDPTRDYPAKVVMYYGSKEGYPFMRDMLKSLKVFGEDIQCIESIHTDLNDMTIQKKNLLICDGAFKVRCKIANKDILKVVHFEFQRKAELNLVSRIFNYQYKLQIKNELPINSLGLLSYTEQKNQNNAGFCIAPALYDVYTKMFIKPIDNPVTNQIISLDLRDIANKIKNNEAISISGRKMDKDGIAWLRLFCSRYLFQKCGDISQLNEKYEYYMNGNETKELKRTIALLCGFNIAKVENIFDYETIKQGQDAAELEEAKAREQEAKAREQEAKAREQEAKAREQEAKAETDRLKQEVARLKIETETNAIESQFTMLKVCNKTPQEALELVLLMHPDNEILVRKIHNVLCKTPDVQEVKKKGANPRHSIQ